MLKALVIGLLVCLTLVPPASASVSEKRVLIVTTEQWSGPQKMYGDNNGEYVVGDLVASGLPFDVVTYGKYVAMDLGNHDIIFLCGHTSPTPVASVAAKCTLAIQQGRKIFVYGDFPHRRYDDAGNRIEYQRYSFGLFGVSDGGSKTLSGPLGIPSVVEKNPYVSAIPHTAFVASLFGFPTEPLMRFTEGGKALGFIGPTGGASFLADDQQKSALDYGKVASYLRFGDGCRAGFANDRIDGKPVAAFEVHCDVSNNINAINALDAFARQNQIPLMCLLVYSCLDSASIARWNSLNNPFICIGSHTYSHPTDWSTLSDANVLQQTVTALALERQVVPSTKSYLAVSGGQNLSSSQLDLLFDNGIVFAGNGGQDLRSFQLPSTDWFTVSRIPTTGDWFRALSQCSRSPFHVSYTAKDDYDCWHSQLSFANELKADWYRDFDNGMYTLDYVHDYTFDTRTNFYVGGTHIYYSVTAGLQWLAQQGVQLVFADDLVNRLHDAQAGWVDTEAVGDGSYNVVVHRPDAKANQVKIQWRNGQVPVASGSAVLSHHLAKDYLYVGLPTEVQSSVNVHYVEPAHFQSSVTLGTGQVTVAWTTPNDPSITNMVVRYGQFYYPESPTDGSPIGSIAAVPGALQQVTGSVDLANAAATHISVFAVGAGGAYSTPPDMLYVATDRVPPVSPAVVIDSIAGGKLKAHWTLSDPNTATVSYVYSVGTTSGDTNSVPATSTTAANVTLSALPYNTQLYLTVKAQNRSGMLSAPVTIPFVLSTQAANASTWTGPNGGRVSLDGIVTAVFADCYYIECPDRSRGMRIGASHAAVHEGDSVSVTGFLDTLPSGERMLVVDH